MKFKELSLKGVFEIETNSFEDSRGAFFRSFCQEEFSVIRPDITFVQLNQSINYNKGTLRGMHYQIPPKAEDKLIRCIKGEVYDVIIDLRKDSPTFLKWTSLVLSSKKNNLIFIPKGFAHGFITLEDDSQLIYHHTEFYNNEYERGLNFKDPLINIDWGIDVKVVSEKDMSYPYIDNNFEGIKL
jgi:dTDP-4-dehydrorhamnose 3,5-epimerase